MTSNKVVLFFTTGSVDLWRMIYGEIVGSTFSGLVLDFRWVKAHAKRYMIVSGFISKHEYVSNHFVDMFAGIGASQHCLPSQTRSVASSILGRSYKTRSRLIEIIKRTIETDSFLAVRPTRAIVASPASSADIAQ